MRRRGCWGCANRWEDRRKQIGKYGFDRGETDLRCLRLERLAAHKRWSVKRDYLRRLIDMGATVEYGVHTVAVERRSRVGHMAPTEYRSLRVS